MTDGKTSLGIGRCRNPPILLKDPTPLRKTVHIYCLVCQRGYSHGKEREQTSFVTNRGSNIVLVGESPLLAFFVRRHDCNLTNLRATLCSTKTRSSKATAGNLSAIGQNRFFRILTLSKSGCQIFERQAPPDHLHSHKLEDFSRFSIILAVAFEVSFETSCPLCLLL